MHIDRATFLQSLEASMVADEQTQFGMLLTAIEAMHGSVLWHDPTVVDRAVLAACDCSKPGYQLMILFRISQQVPDPTPILERALSIIERIQDMAQRSEGLSIMSAAFGRHSATWHAAWTLSEEISDQRQRERGQADLIEGRKAARRRSSIRLHAPFTKQHPTEEEKLFILTVEKYFSSILQTLTAFEQRIKDVPDLFNDPDSLDGEEAAYAEIERSIRRDLEMPLQLLREADLWTVPPTMQDAHQMFLALLDDLTGAAQYLATAYHVGDQRYLSVVQRMVLSANQRLIELATFFKQYHSDIHN